MDGGCLLTCQSFDPNRIIPFGTRLISVKVLPITMFFRFGLVSLFLRYFVDIIPFLPEASTR